MKLLPLTQGQFAKVDDADFERFKHLKWRAVRGSGSRTFYAVHTTPHDENGKQWSKYLHREIMGVTGPKSKIDHINHDGLDNQRHNLRPATNSQNGANRHGADSNSASGVRGVYWNKQKEKYQAHIRVNGKRVFLGLHDRLEDAAAAYAAANKKYFGAFGGNL